MIASSYRLEAPRPRPPPPPLRTNSPGVRSSWRSADYSPGDTQTLLRYEIPSPVTSPPPRSGLGSPTSPRAMSRAEARRARTKSPPANRAMNASMNQPAKDEIEQFAAHCRAWYFHQDDNAGRLMTQTLATLPSAQRAPFAKLQASIRSQYHAHVQIQRQAEYAAHLSSVSPGQSISAAARSDPHGLEAQKERLDKFERFVQRWCTPGMPGTKPFFEGLWALMRLEVIPEHLGGAGRRRIEWEIDDAVFKEASGKDFMFEAIDVLKGVLAFEDTPASKRGPTWSRPGSLYEQPVPHSRSQSQPLALAPQRQLANKPGGISAEVFAKRARAPSDPFLDTHRTLPPSHTDAQPRSLGEPPTLTPSSEVSQEELEELRTPGTTPSEHANAAAAAAGALLGEAEEGDADGYMRVWTAPDLTNPEYLTLLKVFPTFITQRPLPRFPTAGSRKSASATSSRRSRIADEEEGIASAEDDELRIKFGTGEMWAGSRMRSADYEGGWWTRLKLWFRRVFC